jgi:ribokinase
MYYSIGGFTLDDTVLPDGEIRWAAPGGNALYSAVGAKLWGSEVGMITPVGRDYPQEYLDALSVRGFDITGVRRIDHPSFHVWVLHEGNGQRQIIYRLDSGTNRVLDPKPEDLSSKVYKAKGVHICPILGFSQSVLAENLVKEGVPVFYDLIAIQGQIDVMVGQNREIWPKLQAFLPSVEEVRALFGDLPLPDLLEKLYEVGPELFAVKLGSWGSIVRNPKDGDYYHIPAYPTRFVDGTGAGDAFCGGFMVGFQETGDAVQAALYGTVSASFLIEDFGALHALDVKKEQVQERFNYLSRKVDLFKTEEAQF